jgi:hypothetical protein
MYICMQLYDAVQHDVRILTRHCHQQAMDDLQHAKETPVDEVTKQKWATEDLDVGGDTRQSCKRGHCEGMDRSQSVSEGWREMCKRMIVVGAGRRGRNR